MRLAINGGRCEITGTQMVKGIPTLMGDLLNYEEVLSNYKKVLAEMEANSKKKSNQKKSGFAARLEAMQREQQRLAREQAKAQQKKMR